MTMKNTARKLFALLLIAAAGTTQAATKVGWIDAVLPEAGFARDVLIVREGVTRPVANDNRLLFGGDRLIIVRDDISLRIVLGEGKPLTLTQAQASRQKPYLVQAAGEVPTIKKNLLDWISGFAAAKPDAAERVTIATARNVMRPQSLAWSDELAGFSRLQDGPRTLALRWRGGKGPYVLELHSAGQTLASIQTAHNSAQLAASLQAGSEVSLEVRDSAGARITQRVTVLARQSLPPEPAELAAAGLEPAVRQRLYWDWLLATQGEAWALEAWQTRNEP